MSGGVALRKAAWDARKRTRTPRPAIAPPPEISPGVNTLATLCRDFVSNVAQEDSTIYNMATRIDTAARQISNSITDDITTAMVFFTWPVLSRFFFAFIICASGIYINSIASEAASYRNPRVHVLDWHNDTILLLRQLPDLGHDLIAVVLLANPTVAKTLSYLDPFAPGPAPDHIDWHQLPTHFCVFLFSLAIVSLVLHPLRRLIIRRVLFITGVLHWTRAYTVVVTSLPDPSPTCIQEMGNPKGLFATIPPLAAVLQRVYDPFRLTCGDMIFSGHTTVILLSTCTIVHYHSRKYMTANPLLRYMTQQSVDKVRHVIIAIAACGVVCVVATKLHYTLDVSLAVLICMSGWIVYHRVAASCLARRRTVPILSWFEKPPVWIVARRVPATAQDIIGTFVPRYAGSDCSDVSDQAVSIAPSDLDAPHVLAKVADAIRAR